MKKGLPTYIAAILFIFLFVIKGLLTVVPALFSQHFNKASIIVALTGDSEENNKNAEDKAEKEFKEIYVFNEHIIHIPVTDAMACTKNLASHNIIYKQAAYPSIPTPPPELA